MKKGLSLVNMPTTDNQEELFDLVNENDEIVGVITRAQAHSDATLIHRSIGVIVFNHQGEIYLQKRSNSKDTDPGKWGIAVGGHVASGQTYADAVERELWEELGVKGKPQFITKYITQMSNEIEVNAVYKLIHNGPFTLHPQEISKGRFFVLSDLEKQIQAGKIELTSQALVNLHTVVGLLPNRKDLEQMIVRRF